MRRLALALLLVPTFAYADDPAPAPAPTTPPRIVAPSRAEPYRLVRVQVEGAYESAAFSVEPFDRADVRPDDDGRGVTFTGPPGSYVVQSVTLSGKKLLWLRAVVAIGEPPKPVPPPPTPAPPTPDPEPTPAPAPPPAPTPVAGTLHVSYVVDLDTLTPTQASVRAGLAIRAAMGPLDAVYRTYSSGSPELARLNLAKNVAAAGTPTLIVQDTAGRVLLAEKAPPDEAGVVARIGTLRGGK